MVTSARRRRAAAALVLASLALGACGGQDTADRVIEANASTSSTEAAPQSTAGGSDGATTSTTAPPPTTLAPLEAGQQELWVFDLEVGDCFNERIRSEDGVEVETIVKLPCDDPHDNEVFDERAFPQEDGTPYPGNSELTAFADGECLDAFEAFVGVSYVLSVLEIGTVVPTLDGWVEGDRDLTCLLFDPDGEQLTRSMRGAET